MKILHLDIETSPHKVYAWGLWGQDISLNQIVETGSTLCWAAKWHGKKGIMFDSEHKSSHEHMIERIWQLIDSADAVCHYNGTKFDMPTLNKEFLKYDLMPPSGYHEIDLLRTARRKFRLASNKLDFVAQFLGEGEKVKHMGMDLWTQCMAGDDSAWRIMEKYNKQDVALLERVYLRLLPWIEHHPNHALYTNTFHPVCRYCGSQNLKKNGTETTTVGVYQRWRCNDCKSNLKGRYNMHPQQHRQAVLK